MPPKKKQETSKKNEAKKKERVIEDKTFGLKNKKGAKQQKFIKVVNTQVHSGGPRPTNKQEEEKKKKIDEKKKLQDEINALFKPVQSIAKGVDPKSVLCAYYKQGQCGKGDKCKFSHDLNIERKQEKRSVYDDKKEGGMDEMDEAQLEELVNKKHGDADKNKPTTSLICNHFLSAVEASKYGWFWQCPNGAKCIYRHALPPGFVLKKDMKREDQVEKISIEDLVETERAALGVSVTRVTLESFLKWKEKKRQEKIKNLKVETDKKKADYKAGRATGISGRQMFEFNPDLIRNDDDECSDFTFEREVDEDDMKVVDITMDSMLAQASDVDSSGTQASTERFQQNGRLQGNGESSKLDQASALPSSSSSSTQIETDQAIAAAMSATLNGGAEGGATGGLEIDEDLFANMDDDLIDELETLDLEEDDGEL